MTADLDRFRAALREPQTAVWPGHAARVPEEMFWPFAPGRQMPAEQEEQLAALAPGIERLGLRVSCLLYRLALGGGRPVVERPRGRGRPRHDAERHAVLGLLRLGGFWPPADVPVGAVKPGDAERWRELADALPKPNRQEGTIVDLPAGLVFVCTALRIGGLEMSDEQLRRRIRELAGPDRGLERSAQYAAMELRRDLASRLLAAAEDPGSYALSGREAEECRKLSRRLGGGK